MSASLKKYAQLVDEQCTRNARERRADALVEELVRRAFQVLQHDGDYSNPLDDAAVYGHRELTKQFRKLLIAASAFGVKQDKEG